jgi:TetR/AcrR family transcriptional regulator, transcriptional repressor for nem operon
LSSVDNHLKDKAIANLKALEDLFCQYIDRAKRSKTLQTKDDSRIISRYLLNLWNGINITRRIYPSSKVLKPIIEMQLKILK